MKINRAKEPVKYKIVVAMICLLFNFVSLSVAEAQFSVSAGEIPLVKELGQFIQKGDQDGACQSLDRYLTTIKKKSAVEKLPASEIFKSAIFERCVGLILLSSTQSSDVKYKFLMQDLDHRNVLHFLRSHYSFNLSEQIRAELTRPGANFQKLHEFFTRLLSYIHRLNGAQLGALATSLMTYGVGTTYISPSDQIVLFLTGLDQVAKKIKISEVAFQREIARLFYRIGRFSTAEEYYKRCIGGAKSNDDRVICAGGRIFNLAAAKRFDEANQVLQSLRKFDMRQLKGYRLDIFAQSEILLKQKNYSKAVEVLANEVAKLRSGAVTVRSKVYARDLKERIADIMLRESKWETAREYSQISNQGDQLSAVIHLESLLGMKLHREFISAFKKYSDLLDAPDPVNATVMIRLHNLQMIYNSFAKQVERSAQHFKRLQGLSKVSKDFPDANFTVLALNSVFSKNEKNVKVWVARLRESTDLAYLYDIWSTTYLRQVKN